jgi:MFS family permease
MLAAMTLAATPANLVFMGTSYATSNRRLPTFLPLGRYGDAYACFVTTIKTNIPSRLDRLPWSRWHWLVVSALGITWVLDGLEVTIVGTLGSVLQEKETLGLSPREIGLSATAYIAGAVAGALFFGHLTDRLGRRRLFLVTLGVYLVATALTGLSWGFTSFAAFRFLTGAGIGGEYAAMNSAIDELLPARVRGWADLAINGSYWLGTAAGAGLSAALLDPRTLGHALGWRVTFGLGTLLGFAVLLVRRYLPESPRWLMVRGRIDEANAIVDGIEEHVRRSTGRELPPPGRGITLRTHAHVGLARIARTLLGPYRRRAALGLVLMIAQAFFYNAIFFTYALVLTNFYGVAPERVGLYMLPFAAGNFLGPLALGKLFDAVGRKAMIAVTYAASGVLLVVTGWLFERGALTATTQTLLWSLVFFFASTAASSAYLTVSEVFPLELRAMAIALFYAVGTATGGLAAPALFGALIESESRRSLFGGYLLGAVLMLAGAAAAWWLGVAAERKALEDVAAPLSRWDESSDE